MISVCSFLPFSVWLLKKLSLKNLEIWLTSLASLGDNCRFDSSPLQYSEYRNMESLINVLVFWCI